MGCKSGPNCFKIHFCSHLNPFRDIDKNPLLILVQGGWKLFSKKGPEAVPTQHKTRPYQLQSLAWHACMYDTPSVLVSLADRSMYLLNTILTTSPPILANNSIMPRKYVINEGVGGRKIPCPSARYREYGIRTPTLVAYELRALLGADFWEGDATKHSSVKTRGFQ